MSWSISIISQPMAWRSGLATRGSPACCGGPLEASVAGKSENSAGSFTGTSILLEPQNHTARRAATLVKSDLWSKNDRLSAPWTQDGVPPLSFALRGGSLLYYYRRTVKSAGLSA